MSGEAEPTHKIFVLSCIATWLNAIVYQKHV